MRSGQACVLPPALLAAGTAFLLVLSVLPALWIGARYATLEPANELRETSFLLGLVLVTGTSEAAVEPKPTWPERAWNAQPANGDLVLPMPCGGAMTFRRIEVPSTGELDDYKITVGGRDEARAPIENAHAAYVERALRRGGSRAYSREVRGDD